MGPRTQRVLVPSGKKRGNNVNVIGDNTMEGHGTFGFFSCRSKNILAVFIGGSP